MKILITRPEGDAKELAAVFSEMGLEHITFPLLEIVPQTYSIENPDQYQAVLVTSSNAVKCLVKDAQFDVLCALPVYAVGDASSKAALEHGFTTVFSADGDLPALEALVAKKTSPGDGPLLYLSGEVISGDLRGSLTKSGYSVDRVALYSAEQATVLPASVTAPFARGEIGGVVLYSKRSAQIFADLFNKAGVSLKNTCLVFCLSSPVASTFCDNLNAAPEECGFDIKTSARPNQEDILKLISENMA